MPLIRLCSFLWAFLMFGAAAAPALAQPGRLLQATPIAGAPEGANVWRIRYETRDKDSNSTESTGILVSPTGRPPTGGRAVVAWAHGTTGIAEDCAPSLGKKALSGIPDLAGMIARGWSVVASDYPGLGTTGPHPYLVGDAAAYAVLDAVRAARGLAEAGAGTRFTVWGHSQGGHAALFAGRHAARYAPELQLVGIVAAAPPTDLTANFKGMSATIRGVLTALTAQSWSQVYGADLATVANKATQGIIRRTAQTCDGETSVAGLVRAVRLRHRLGNIDLTNTEPWMGLLARNSASPPGKNVPLLVIQGEADPLISAAVTRDYVSRACKTGAKIRLIEVESKDHAGIATETMLDATGWIADRFAGRAAPTTCQ